MVRKAKKIVFSQRKSKTDLEVENEWVVMKETTKLHSGVKTSKNTRKIKLYLII